MTKEEINDTIATLARSQGFYGRLKRALDEADDDAKGEFYAQFANCRDRVDFVMRLES